MKRIYNKDKSLESHRFFPYIAWSVVILFSVFVYKLTESVSAKKMEIESNLLDEDAYLVPIDELRTNNMQR